LWLKGTDVRILAVDLGTKRIGLALSDPDGVIASPLFVLQRRGGPGDLAEVAAIAKDYEAGEIVVGLPVNLRGAEAEAAQAARREIAALQALTPVPVVVCDERLTTAVAQRGLREGGLSTRQQRGLVDKLAATVLLQTYLEGKRRRNEPQ